MLVITKKRLKYFYKKGIKYYIYILTHKVIGVLK